MISLRVFWNAGRLMTKERRNRALSTCARFLPRHRLFPAAFLRASWSAKDAIRQIAHRGFAEFPRGTPGAFFPAVAIVAEQTRNRVSSAEKVDLKAVSLFLGAGF